jgi:hypothetical protein
VIRTFTIHFGAGAGAAGGAVLLRTPGPGRLPIGAGPVGMRTRKSHVTLLKTRFFAIS